MRAAWVFATCLFMASTLACCCPKMGKIEPQNQPDDQPEKQPEKKTYSRDDFRKLVDGKTPEEVSDAVGNPDDTSDGEGVNFWYYRNTTINPATGKVDGSAQVVFKQGRVAIVNNY